jgi:hypothetical protein
MTIRNGETMTVMPFKEEFATAVEDGSKGQSIRGAECITKDCMYNGGDVPYCSSEKPECFFTCRYYKHRYKVGDTLQLYTGLMQRKYCKRKVDVKNPDKIEPCHPAKRFNLVDKNLRCIQPDKDKYGYKCGWLGAKLLKTATCTESFPIKFEDLTEEIAYKDGFIPQFVGGYKMHITSLELLQEFLIKTYDAKDGMVFQITRW